MPERTLLDDLIENKKKGVGFEAPALEYITNAFEPTRLDSNLYKEGKEQGVDFSNIRNNLELIEAVADSQSTSEKWLNDLGRLGTGAVSATVGGFAMIPAFFDAASSMELSAMYENGAVKWAEGLDEWGQEKFKNYYTQRQEEAYKEASIFEKMTYGEKFWGNSVLANAGFMIGAAVDEAIFSALTAVTGGGAAPLQAVETGWLAARLARRLAEAGTEVMGSGTNLIKNVYRGFTAEGEIAKQAMMSGLKNSRQLLTSAGYESSVEALQFQKEAYNQVLEKKANELGISKEELENNPQYERTLGELKSGVNSVANGLWLMNLATVGSSNAIGATALFQLEKPILNMLEGVNPLRAFMSAGVEDLAKTAGKEIGKDGVQFAAKNLSMAQKAFNIVKSPLSEGTEEFSQGLYQDVGKRYLEDKYNPNAIDMILNGIPLMADEIGKRLGDSSHSGWEEFASGFMSSLLGLPNVGRFVGKKENGTYGLKNDKEQPAWVGGIFQGIAENRQIQNERNENAALNNFLSDKNLAEMLDGKLSTDNITTASVKAFPMIMAAQKRLADGIKSGDKFEQNQAKHDLLAYAAIARDKIGQGENFKKDVLAQYDQHTAILQKGVTAESTQEEIEAVANLESIYQGNTTQEKIAEVNRKKKNTEIKLKDIEAGISRAKAFNLSPDLQDRMAVALSNGNNRVSEANSLLKALQASLKLPNIQVSNLSSNELYELLDKHKVATSKHKKISDSLQKDKAEFDSLPDEIVAFEGESPRANEKKKAVKERVDNWTKELDAETARLEKELNKKVSEVDFTVESPLTQYKQAIDKLTGDEKVQAESLFNDVQRAINQHKEAVKEYNKIMNNPEEIIAEENTIRKNTARKIAGIVEKNESSSKLPEKNTSNNAHTLVGKETTKGKITNVVHHHTEEGSAIIVDTDKGNSINLAQVSFIEPELKGLMEEYIKQQNALLPNPEAFRKQLESIKDKEVVNTFVPFLVQLQQTVKRRKEGIKTKIDNFSTHPTKLSPIESDGFKVEMRELIEKSPFKKGTIEFAPLNTRNEVPKDLQIIDVGDYETKGDKDPNNQFGKELPGTAMFSKKGVKGRVKLAVTVKDDTMVVYGIVPNVASFSFNYSEQDQKFGNVPVATIETIEGKKTVVLTPEFIKVLDFIGESEQKKSFVAWNNITGYESKDYQYGKDMEILSLTSIAEKYKPNKGEPVVFWNNNKIVAMYLDGNLITEEKQIDKWKKDNNVKKPINKDEKSIILYNGKPGSQKPKFQMDGVTPRAFSWNSMGVNEEADFEAIKEAQKQLKGAKTEVVVTEMEDKSATAENIALDEKNKYKSVTEFRMVSPLSHGESHVFLNIDTSTGSANIMWKVDKGKAKLLFNRTLNKIQQAAVDLSKIAKELLNVEESGFYEWLEKAEPQDIRDLIERFLEKKNTKVVSVYRETVEEHNKFQNRFKRGSITAFVPNIQWIATVSTKTSIKDIPGIGLVEEGKELKITYLTGEPFIGTVMKYDGKAITFGKVKVVNGVKTYSQIGTPLILEKFKGTISIPTAEDKKKVTPSNPENLTKTTTFITIKKELIAFLKIAENKQAILNWMNGLKTRANFTDLSQENLKELSDLCAKKIDEFKNSSKSNVEENVNIIETPSIDIITKLNTLNTFQEKLEWLRKNNLISPITINGKQYDVIDYSDRVMVMAKLGKYNIPFYISTGQAGKKNVKAGNWYVVFGIGESGWINKGSEELINKQYDVPFFQKFAKILNEGVGTIESREDNGNGKLKEGIGFLGDDINSINEFNKQMNLTTIPAKSPYDSETFFSHVKSTISDVNEELKSIYEKKNETSKNPSIEEENKELIGKQVGTSNYSVENGLIFYNNLDGTVSPVLNPNGKSIIEAVKDDIKRREQEELNKQLPHAPSFLIKEYPNSDEAREINAKYDKELKALEENTPPVPKIPINKPEYNINDFIIQQYTNWTKGLPIIGLNKSQQELVENALKGLKVNGKTPRGEYSVANFLIALPIEEVPPFKIAIPGQTVEFEEAFNNIKDLAPDWMKIQKADEDMLRNMAANLGGLGQEQIMGWFDSVINIRQSSNAGTEYHELFHGIFNMVLDDAAKKKLIDEALTKYPLDYQEIETLMKRHRISKGEGIKLFLEEKMADDFMEFMKGRKSYEKKSFLGRVFEWLKKFIFGDLGEIHSIFTKIANGKFKTAKAVNKDFKNIRTLVIKYDEFNEQTNSYIQRILPAEDAYNILNTLSRYIAFDKMNFEEAYEKVMNLFKPSNYETDLSEVSDEKYEEITNRLSRIWNILDKRKNVEEVKKEVEQRIALYGLEIEDDGTIFSVENEEKGNNWSKSILEMGGFLQTSGKWRQMLAFTTYDSFEYGVQMTLPIDIVTVNNYLELISQNLKKQDIFERLEKITMKDSPMAYQAFQNIKENISKEIDVPVYQLTHETMWGKSMIYSTLTDQLHKTNSNPIDTMIYKNKTNKKSVVHANAKSAGKAQLDKWVVKYNEVKDTFSLFERFLDFQKEVFTDIKKLFEDDIKESEISDKTVYDIQSKLEKLGISVTTAYIRECLHYNRRVMELSGLEDSTLTNLVYENGLFLISDKKQHETLADVIEFVNSFIEDENRKLASTLSASDVRKRLNSKDFFYKHKWTTLKTEFPDVAGKDIYHNLINTAYIAPMLKANYSVFSIVTSKNVKNIFEDVGGVDALRGNLTKLANGNANFDESVRKTSYKTMDNKTVYETIYNNYVKEMERALSKAEFRDFITSLKGREITQDDVDKFTEFLSLPNDEQTKFVNQRMLAWLQNSPLVDFIDNDFEVNFLGGFKEVKTSSTGESAESKKNLGMAFDDATIADSFRVGFINWKEKNLVRPVLLSGKSTQLVFSTNKKLKENFGNHPLIKIQDARPVVSNKAVEIFKSLLEQELERIKWVRDLSPEDKKNVDDEIEGYIKKGSTFSQNTGFAKYLKENGMKDILKKLEQADSLDEVEIIDEIIANYMNNHLRKSYEFLQGVRTQQGYVGGKIQSTDDFFYQNDPIIENGILNEVEFAEYEIDSWLKSEILYQFVAFDKAMGLEGVIDTFKRSGSIIASGSSSIGSLNHVTIDDKSLAHFIGMEEAQEDSAFIKENAKRYWDDTGGKEGFEEAYQAALKGEKHKNLPPTLGEKVDRFDADSVATIEVLIDHILVPQGKFTKEVKAIYDKIKVGIPLSHKEYEYLRLNNALNQKRKMSYVQGLFYKKTSTQFIGIEEFAFIKPSIAERKDVLEYLLSEYQKVQEGALTYKKFIENNYNVRIGRERMFNVMTAMYNADTQYLFFKTSSKQLKRNLIKPKSYDTVHEQINSDRNSSMNTEYLREQMKTDGVKSEITHGTQLMQLVWSEQNPNNILYTTKGENGTVITSKTLKEEYLHLLASRINFIKEKIKKEAGYDGSTLDTEVLRKIFGESIMQNGGQNYLYEFVTEVDWNIPHTNEKVQNMFFSYLSKSLSQKREGTALALQSDFIHQIIRAKEDIIIDGQTLLKDEVIPSAILEKYYDDLKDSDKIFVGRLRHGIWNGEFFYGEAIVPNIHEALQNGIPETFQYGFKIRIPTQDKHSMMAIRFVDTMPGYKGATIVMPLETIFLAGEDFDIDKAYLYWSAVYKNKQGEWKSYGEYTNVNDAWAEYKSIMRKAYKSDAKSDYVPLTIETFFENIEDYITVDKEKQEKYNRLFDKLADEIELWEQVNDIMNKTLLVSNNKDESKKITSKQKISSRLRNKDFEMSEELKVEIQELIESFEDEKLFIYLKKIGEAYSKESFQYKIGDVAKGMHERMEQNKVGYRGVKRKYNSKEELNNDLLYCELRLIHNKGNQNISITPATMDSQTDLIYNEVLLDYNLQGTGVIRHDLRQFMESEGIDTSDIPAAIQKYIDVKGFAVRDTNHAPTDILKAENMEAIGEDNIGIGAKFSIVSQLYLDKIGTKGIVGQLMEQNFSQIGAEYYLDGFYRINDVSSGVISAATDNAKEQIAGAIGHDRLNLPIIQSAQLLLGYHYFTTMTLRRSKKVAALLEKLSIYDDEKLVRGSENDKKYNDEKLLEILKTVENVDNLIAEVQNFKGFETAPDFENINTYNRNFLIMVLSLAAQDENFKSEEFENYALAKFKEAKRFANFNRNLAQISNLAKGVEINFGEIKGVVRAVHQAVNDKEFGAIAQEILNEEFLKAELSDMIDDMNIGRTFFLQGQKIFDGLENVIEETVGSKFYREKEYSAFRNGFSAFILSKIIKNQPNFDKEFLIASTQADLVDMLLREVNERFPNNLLVKALTTKEVDLLSKSERMIEEDETGDLAEQYKVVPRKQIVQSIYGATEFKFFQTNTWAESNKFLTERIQNEAKRWNDMTVNVSEVLARINKGEELSDIFDSTTDRFADDKLKAFFNAVLFYQSLYKDNLLFRNGSVATILDPRMFKIYGVSMGEVVKAFNNKDNAKIKELLGKDIKGVQREFLRKYLTSYDAYTLVPTLIGKFNEDLITQPGEEKNIITIKDDTLIVDFSEQPSFRAKVNDLSSEQPGELISLEDKAKRARILRAERLDDLRKVLKEAKSDIKLDTEHGWIVAKFPLIIKNVTVENGKNIITRYVLKEVKQVRYDEKMTFTSVSGKTISDVLLNNTANLSPISFTELMSTETKKQEVFGNKAVYVKVEVIGNKDIKQYMVGEEEEWNDTVEEIVENPKTSINIYSGNKENPELSNFAKRPFKYEGRDYQSVEHAYQTLKSGKFDESTYNRPNDFIGIKRNAPKQVNKNISSTLMKKLIKTSFEQNVESLNKLKATGNAILTHLGGTDKFWEIEFPKLLMEVRDELSSETNQYVEAAEMVEVEKDEIVPKQVEEVKKEINLSIYALRPASIDTGNGDITFKTVESAYNAIKLYYLEGLSASLIDVDAKIKELQQAETSQKIAFIMKDIKYNEAEFNVDARENMKGLIIDSYTVNGVVNKDIIEALMTQALPKIPGFEGLMEEIRDEFAEQYGKQVKASEDKKIVEDFKKQPLKPETIALIFTLEDSQQDKIFNLIDRGMLSEENVGEVIKQLCGKK